MNASPPKSKSKLEARADLLPSDTGSLLGPLLTEYQAQWKPCPTSDGATTLTQRRNSKERNTTGETEKVGKEPWDVQFFP